MDKSPQPNGEDFCPDLVHSPSPNHLPDKKQDFSILEKLKELREARKYCDIILEVRGIQLEAHKNILASWSPYFASKLFPDDPTVCKDYVIVNYNNSEVFADLLDFMYNGYVAPRETNFLELLHLAVSFQIQMLKNYCEEFLRCNLHLGNFVSTYFLSRKFRLESLEEYIVGFLQLNLSDAVKQGEFLALTASKFNTFLSEGSMNKIKPEIKLFLIISWVGYDVQDREKYLVLLLGHIDWSAVANDFLLEINRTENFFTSHESSLYVLLQTLFSTGIPLGPYTETFPLLRDRHSTILNEVVTSSVIQIEQEEFYPVTIIVRSRPLYREAMTNTWIAQKVDCAVNTDVNSLHFEEHEEEETQDAGVAEETVDESVPASLAQEFDERYNEFGKFIESEIYELNRKEFAKIELEQHAEQVHLPVTNIDPVRDSRQQLYAEPIESSTPNTRSRQARLRMTISRQERLKTYEFEEANETKTGDYNYLYEKEHEYNQESEHGNNHKDTPNNVSDHIDTSTNMSTYNDASINVSTHTDASTNISSDIDDNVPQKSNKNKAKIVAQIKTPRKRNKSGSTAPQEPQVPIPCSYEDCPYYTFTQDRMDRHVKLAHLSSFELRCNLCPFITKEVRKFNYHMKTHFVGPPFKCDYPRCNFSDGRISKLLKHRDSHTDERPFTCDCGKSFKTNNTLTEHGKTHEGRKEYKCPVCGIAFAKKNTVNQHMVTHSEVRPYLCDLCGFSTKYQSHLISHKRIHTGDVFACSFPKCTYETPKRSQLKAHMRAHLGVRSHVCQVCGKSFVEKGHLLRHERIHTNERIACNECDYTTTRSDKLREHMKKYHSEDGNVSPKKTKSNKKQKEMSTVTSKKVMNNVRVRDMESTNSVKSVKSPSEIKKVASVAPSEVTTPMLVKWDHGGYSISNDSPSQTDEHSIVEEDTYSVLRDQLTSNEPMQQMLTLNEVQGQLNVSKNEEAKFGSHKQCLEQNGASQDKTSNRLLNISESLDCSQSTGDHVTTTSIVTTVMEGDQGQTYTIVQHAAGTTVSNQEYGGLGAFMALF